MLIRRNHSITNNFHIKLPRDFVFVSIPTFSTVKISNNYFIHSVLSNCGPRGRSHFTQCEMVKTLSVFFSTKSRSHAMPVSQLVPVVYRLSIYYWYPIAHCNCADYLKCVHLEPEMFNIVFVFLCV